jgi:hypothetical protein
MQAGKERAAKERPAPDYPAALPELRMRIVIERFDPGATGAHVFELRKSRRVDQFRVSVDGKAWKVAGLAKVLEAIRKATPRMLSERAL